MIRSLLAVGAGYLVFGLSAALLFGLSGQDPHAAPSLAFGVGATLYGVLFAALAGFVTAWLAPRSPVAHARILALLIGAIALASLAVQVQTGSVWSEVATVTLMASAVLVGGWIRQRRARVATPES